MAWEDRKAQISSYDCETQGQKLFMILFLCSNLLAQQAVTGQVHSPVCRRKFCVTKNCRDYCGNLLFFIIF